MDNTHVGELIVPFWSLLPYDMFALPTGHTYVRLQEENKWGHNAISTVDDSTIYLDPEMRVTVLLVLGEEV